MKERPVDSERTVVAHHQASVISEPADGAFDDPAPPIAPQGATILSRRSNAIPFVGTDQLDAAPPQPLAQRIAVVSFVGNHAHRLLPRSAPAMTASYTDRRERFFREADFRRGCRVKVVS